MGRRRRNRRGDTRLGSTQEQAALFRGPWLMLVSVARSAKRWSPAMVGRSTTLTPLHATYRHDILVNVHQKAAHKLVTCPSRTIASWRAGAQICGRLIRDRRTSATPPNSTIGATRCQGSNCRHQQQLCASATDDLTNGDPESLFGRIM